TNVTGIDDTSATLFGAVWLADYIGSFFAAGGKATYFFHYFDDLFTLDKNYQIRQPTAQWMAAQVITQEWVQPLDAEHRVLRATSDLKDSEGNVIVTAYAVLRPDEQWSVMLINKDFDNERQVRLVFHDRVAGRDLSLEGKVTMVTFGRNQYEWHREGDVTQTQIVHP